MAHWSVEYYIGNIVFVYRKMTLLTANVTMKADELIVLKCPLVSGLLVVSHT